MWHFLKERIENDTGSGSKLIITEEIPISLFYAHNSGLFGNLTFSKVNQKVENLIESDNVFNIINFELGFKFSKNGRLSFSINNLTNKEFDYQDNNYLRPEEFITKYLPEKAFLGEIKYVF